MLFDFAEQSGKLFALERLCREKALQNLGAMAQGQKLFLNIHPKTMADPEFTHGQTLELIEEAGLSPENVVFEITERHSINEFALFPRKLDHYRSQGYLVAVDDAGAGYSGLTSVAQIRPEFIKIDMLSRTLPAPRRAMMRTAPGSYCTASVCRIFSRCAASSAWGSILNT